MQGLAKGIREKARHKFHIRHSPYNPGSPVTISTGKWGSNTGQIQAFFKYPALPVKALKSVPQDRRPVQGTSRLPIHIPICLVLRQFLSERQKPDLILRFPLSEVIFGSWICRNNSYKQGPATVSWSCRHHAWPIAGCCFSVILAALDGVKILTRSLDLVMHLLPWTLTLTRPQGAPLNVSPLASYSKS